MQLFVDESYRAQPHIYVLACLAIYYRPSQRVVHRAVAATIQDVKKRLKPFDSRLPVRRIPELKGSGRDRFSLNDDRELRDRFFRRLHKARCRIYVMYCGPDELARWGRARKRRKSVVEEAKYGRRLQNLMAYVQLIPPEARFIGVTIDSQNTTKPTQEGAKLFTRRKARLCQKEQRKKDKARHRRWIQQIKDILRNRYRGRHVRVWLVPSHLHACLQAIDVVANFCQRYCKLGFAGPPHAYEAVSKRKEQWFSGYRILADRIWWMHEWHVRKPKQMRGVMLAP